MDSSGSRSSGIGRSDLCYNPPMLDKSPSAVSRKPRENLAAEVMAVLPAACRFAGEAVAVEVEAGDRKFLFSIDERSANFLAHALLSYLKPFQSAADSGTPSFDASNPNT